MITVHKYTFDISDPVEIETRKDARVLLVEMQNNTPCMWLRVDTDKPWVTRKFRISGTGHPVPRDAVHVASFQMPPFVWHVWE